MSLRVLLRLGAAVATVVGTAAGIVTANPALVSAALPPRWASIVTLLSLVAAAALHETAHASPAPSAPPPADPASKETP